MLRLNLLGQPLRDGLSERTKPKNTPWVIGLTGAVASGKSSVAKHLQGFAGDRLRVLNIEDICRRVLE